MPPSNPGEILKELFIKPRNLTIKEVAGGSGIIRTSLSILYMVAAGLVLNWQ